MSDNAAAKAAEQAVTGALLLDAKELLPRALETLREEDFMLAECRNVFTACRELFMAQEPVDPLTVLHRLGGGEEHKVHLTGLAESAPPSRSADSYFAIVRENAKRRRATAATAQLHEDLLSGEGLDHCQETAAKLLEDLSDTGESKSFSSSELYYRLYNRMSQPVEYLPTGFSQLDRHIAMEKGDFVILGGRPSTGKTAFTLQMLVAMAREHETVYFSLETGADALMERMAAFYTGTPFPELVRHSIQNWKPLAEGYDRFSKLKLHIVEAAGWTVEKLRAKVVSLQAEVIFIDYLQLLDAGGSSRFEKVTNISISLHTLAQQAGILVIALSQLSREGDGSPDMESLRESGQLEQDADVVLLLNSGGPKDQSGARDLIIGKNKKGRRGQLKFHFDGEFQKFTSIAM